MSSQETHVDSCTDDGTDEERRTVLACPECDSSDIRTNNNGLQGCKAPADHVCRDCGHAFNDADAVRRPLKRSGTTPPSIARSLETASPEDVGKPITDGGHEPDYDCRYCDWAGDECDRRDHYPVCPDCSRIVEIRQQLVADGGVPETFDDLAGTCEHCGEDVDPERLIEGECPGCHYRPVADGGTTWTNLTGFKRDLLEAIRRLENDDETVYGLAIKEEVESVYDTEILHGRLYPNLDDLVEAGLIEKGELDRRTNEYQLTTQAEAMLEQRVRVLADACGMEQPVADGGAEQ
ncbi:helix-turn-helix transcriptional regulator [Halolamina rubra]|uniref:helix-turn-helix transcriptional regulator n=1 Tax=Halolamina rubra TaxID=1380430 RepID=UPI0009E37256|nr:helix-turn-helix transcriptional regulator [Halolamina rubra]